MARRLVRDAQLATPSVVAELSSPENESPSFLTPDGCTLYLTSDRPGDLAGFNIWRATRPK